MKTQIEYLYLGCIVITIYNHSATNKFEENYCNTIITLNGVKIAKQKTVDISSAKVWAKQHTKQIINSFKHIDSIDEEFNRFKVQKSIL